MGARALLLGSSLVATEIAVISLVFIDDSRQHAEVAFMVIMFYSSAGMYMFWRWRASTRARACVKDDEERYADLWARLLVEQQHMLRKLDEVIDFLQVSSASSASMSTSLRQQDPNGDICDLDRLFLHARLVDPIFQKKVEGWAQCSKGEAASTSLKSEKRAVQKVIRAYGNDPSRLVDISRSSIIFDSLEDLVQCIAEVQKDRETRVVKVKNRLSNSYDSAASGGYRDCVLYLIINTSQAAQVEVLQHIVELQLLLQQYAKLKKGGGHKRYRSWRDSLGQ